VRYINLITNSTVEVKASKEIIISAGALLTPWVLMLSGIGDANSLNKFGIPVIVNATKVGKNLIDHLKVDMQWEYLKDKTPIIPSLHQYWAKEEITYSEYRTGLLSTISPKMVDLWVSSAGNTSAPDFQVVWTSPITNYSDASNTISLLLQPVYHRAVSQD